MTTATSHYLRDISDDSYRALRSSHEADTGLLPRGKCITQYLNPGNTKRFVKREPMSWLKCYSIILDTHAYTAIIASEFFETYSRCDICVICHFSTEHFLPFIPTWHIVSKPREYWPEDECPEEKHEKYFHRLIVSQIFHHCKSLRAPIYPRPLCSQMQLMRLEYRPYSLYCVCHKYSPNYEKNHSHYFYTYRFLRFCLRPRLSQLCWIPRWQTCHRTTETYRELRPLWSGPPPGSRRYRSQTHSLKFPKYRHHRPTGSLYLWKCISRCRTK